MSRYTRAVVVIFSFLLANFAMLTTMMFISDYMMNAMIALFMRIQKIPVWRSVILIFSALMFVAAMSALVVAVMSGRLRRARVRNNSLGTVDVGVDAIESIALNAAKSSQSGVKSAKARVAPTKGDKLSVRLSVDAYSDVELPAMMSRVQERVKKDIERYTGIEVAEVIVKVSKVDASATRFEQ